MRDLLLRMAPGLVNLLGYRREWLRSDAAAGVSVAAVALPTAIAYAELIGFEPVVGLYAAILPLLVYAIFGTSRHLIVNPDAATCAMVGTALMPLIAIHPNALVSLSVVLAFFTGIFCILAGLLRLGFVADFLAKPILVGFLNGVAIHIFLGQIGKVFGFSMKSHGIVPSLLEFMQKVPQTHLPTLAVGVLTIGVMLAGKRWLPRWPAPLLAWSLRWRWFTASAWRQRGLRWWARFRPVYRGYDGQSSTLSSSCLCWAARLASHS
jgi:MFS superfamily sulfate permease-like transporter